MNIPKKVSVGDVDKIFPDERFEKRYVEYDGKKHLRVRRKGITTRQAVHNFCTDTI